MSEKKRFTTKGFSDKEKLFCDYYLGEAKFVAVNAVVMAGYECKTPASARSLASQIKNKPKIKNYLEQELAALTIGKGEILAELAKQATANIFDLLDENGMFDAAKAKENGTDSLIKKIKITTTEKTVDVKTGNLKTTRGSGFNPFDNDEPEQTEKLETSLITKTVELEIWNKQTALELIGKNLKLWTDKIEATGADGEPLGGGVVLLLPDNGRGDAGALQYAAPGDVSGETGHGNDRGEQ